jgi:hypothetical protein
MYVSTSSYSNGVLAVVIFHGNQCVVWWGFIVMWLLLVLGSKIKQSPVATAKPVCSAPGYMRPVRCNAPEVSTLDRLRSWPLGGAS